MTEYLFKKNYLVMIENAAKGENWMFRNFYIRENRVEGDMLENGGLSCAIFVCSILYLHNSLLEFLKKKHWIKLIHSNVSSTEKDMTDSGWYEIKELKPGAVIIWEKKLGSNDKIMHFHIGFCLSETKAVSNNSKGTGFPWKHHVTYNGTRKIEKIYWHPELEND